MGCPACGPATGAEAQTRHQAVVREKARRFREALSAGWFTPAACRAGLVWAVHVLLVFPETEAGLSGDRSPPAS
ncbi:MAG TPA: hypothetical protein VE953_26470 [Terriglobales bacterium]|nr:hypothetical protein [Terriglobales bacterium]